MLAKYLLMSVNLFAPVPFRHAQKVLHPEDGALGAFIYAAGKRIRYEFALEERINEAHQGMVNHAVGKWRCLDHAHLRLEDGEFSLLARRPGLPDQVVL